MDKDLQRLYDETTPKDGTTPTDLGIEGYVYTHDGHCNDYTGCNDGCGWTQNNNAVWRSGAWRRK